MSRCVAAFQWQNTGQLVWSNYLSFSKTIFNPPYNSVDNFSRRGNMLNGCVHRSSDPLVWASPDRPVGIYSLFNETAPPTNDCQAEILAEQRSRIVKSDMERMTACATANWVTTVGNWSINAVDALTGSGVNA